MLKTTDNLSLFVKNYPIQNPKARILLVHGLGEHCLRYTHVAEAFSAIGFEVYTFDLRGHGQSEGERAFVTDIQRYCEDVEAVYQTIPKDLPFYMLGHSMGGLITLKFLVQQPRPDVRGAIFSGAALQAGDDITPFVIFITKLLAKFFPKLQTTKLDPKSISRDAETVKNYASDPLIYHDGLKTGLGMAVLKAFDEVKARFANFDYPVLIMHGGADKITNIKGSKEFYEKAASRDKTFKIWDGAYHEIFNETNRAEVIAFMTNWAQKTL
jgi:alpha-beta hydrolase superfamily lysophospholipase